MKALTVLFLLVACGFAAPRNVILLTGSTNYIPIEVISLAVTGASTVAHETTNQYEAVATYTDLALSNVTAAAVWTEDNTNTTINAGELIVDTMTDTQTVNVAASFGGITNALAVDLQGVVPDAGAFIGPDYVSFDGVDDYVDLTALMPATRENATALMRLSNNDRTAYTLLRSYNGSSWAYARSGVADPIATNYGTNVEFKVSDVIVGTKDEMYLAVGSGNIVDIAAIDVDFSLSSTLNIGSAGSFQLQANLYLTSIDWNGTDTSNIIPHPTAWGQMWDTVSETAFPNAGTGNLVCGFDSSANYDNALNSLLNNPDDVQDNNLIVVNQLHGPGGQDAYDWLTDTVVSGGKGWTITETETP